MKYKSIVKNAMILTLTTATANADFGPSIICIQEKAYVLTVEWDTGCRTPKDEPFFKTLSLKSESPEKGTILVELGYASPKGDPICDNPRGSPHFFNLPLPVDKGVWEIDLIGVGKSVLKFEPSCRVER